MSRGLALLLAVCVAVYFPLMSAGFVWDDPTLILENTWTLSWASAPQAFSGSLWGGVPNHDGGGAFYRPLMLLSLTLDRQLFGLTPAGYHLHSIAWHLAAVALLWRLLRGLAPRGALVGAALYALHPLQLEAVAFIAARNDSMAVVGVLGAWLLLSPNAPDAPDAPQALKPPRLIAAAALAFGALLSKEAAVIALPGLLCLDLARWGRPRGLSKGLQQVLSKGLPRYLALLAATGLWWTLRSLATLDAPPMTVAPEALLTALSWDLGLLLNPNLGSPAQVLSQATPSPTSTALALLLLIGLTSISASRRPYPIVDRVGRSTWRDCWRLEQGVCQGKQRVRGAIRRVRGKSSRPGPDGSNGIRPPRMKGEDGGRWVGLAGLGVALLGLAPALAGAAVSDSLAHRYLTLPLVGLSILLAAAVHRSPLGDGRRPEGLAVALIAPLGLGTALALPAWTSNIHFWEDALARSPSTHSACGLFKAREHEPNPARAADALRLAVQPPPSQYCCLSASRWALDRAGPDIALAVGEAALRQGCEASPELVAPIALSEALTGRWEAAEARAASLGGDPYGYVPVVLTAAALRRGDEGVLEAWAARNPGEDVGALESQARWLLERSR